MGAMGWVMRRVFGVMMGAALLVFGGMAAGATAPGAVGNVNTVVTGSGASAQASTNTTVTAATYRDAVRVQVQTDATGNYRGLGGAYVACYYTAVGNASDGRTTAMRGALFTPCAGYVTVKPGAYPLWNVQNGTPGRNVLVVPPTQNSPSGTPPTKSYGIEVFRA